MVAYLKIFSFFVMGKLGAVPRFQEGPSWTAVEATQEEPKPEVSKEERKLIAHRG